MKYSFVFRRGGLPAAAHWLNGLLPGTRPVRRHRRGHGVGWLVALVLTLLAPATVLAQYRPHAPRPQAAAAAAGQPIAGALNPDGTLRPGTSGSFNPAGYRMGTNPTTGQPTFRPAGAGDENWDDRFCRPGPFVDDPNDPINSNNRYAISAMAVLGTDLYVSYDDVYSYSIPSVHVAKWNGTSWSNLPGTFSAVGNTNGSIAAMGVSGATLYVAGFFTAIGSVVANNIAKWNGSAWSALGSGLTGGSSGSASALAVSGTDVYVMGDFASAGGIAANNIAKWNGSAWNSLGAGISGGNGVGPLAVSGTSVYAIDDAILTDGSGVVIGYKDEVVKWDGSMWSVVGTTGVYAAYPGSLTTLTASGTDVYVGGTFTAFGGVAANHIAKWNGSAWTALGSGVTYEPSVITVWGADVYVGDITTAGGVAVNGIAKWNGSAWSALGTGTNGGLGVKAITATSNGLYVGGWIALVDGVVTYHVAKWSNNMWSALGAGLMSTGENNGITQSFAGLATAVVTSGTDVYVGGLFTSATVAANNIAKWNGSAWSALGTGVNGKVKAIAISGPNVYVGGYFTVAGGVPATNIAKWNGSTWSALGSGFSGQVIVNALAVVGTDVYAGGSFIAVGGVAVNSIAKWNGSTWSALGTGVAGGNTEVVNALAASGTDLYVAGDFATAGGVTANGIAKWNGTTWSALGTGLDPYTECSTLAVVGTDVYVGGSGIFRWNGSTWTTISESGTRGYTYALAVSGTDLYAPSVPLDSNAMPSPTERGPYKWDGSTWSRLGTGLSSPVDAQYYACVQGMAVSPNGDVNMVGDFTTTGDGSKQIVGFGIWHPAAPTSVAFLPASGPVGTSVTISGPNLSGATAVRFNGTLVSTFSYNAVAHLLTALVPAGATTGALSVTTAGGTLTSPASFTVTGPAPTLASFTPASGPVGTVVTLTGTYFTGVTAVRFNGTAATTYTVGSATSITATVPAGATSGPISVTTVSGTAASATAFTVVPTVTITSFTPTSAVTGTIVTLAGTNLTGATSVSFNGITATPTNITATSLKAVVPATATTGPISVTTPGGTGTSTTPFTVLPKISSFAPAAGAAVGATVTLTGSGFTGVASVSFNGVAAASFALVSATSVTAVVPAAATTGVLTLTTPAGTATSVLFKVVPKITSFSPASGAPGTAVTITGTGFTGATAVKFLTAAATSLTVVSSTTITTTVPPAGLTGKVYVTTPGGTATSAASFTVAPTISSFTPAQGAPGSLVIVTGLNFTSTTKLYFHGTLAATTYVSTTQLTATVPAGATSGPGPLAATNATGTGTSATPYTVTSGVLATITGFTSLNMAVGTSITITGTNLAGATAVRFNTATTTGALTSVSATQLVVTVPVGATTGPIYVVTPTGMVKSAASLTIIPVPTVTSFSPPTGSPGSVVFIAGTQFAATTMTTLPIVKFNGVSAAFTVNSAAQIVATVPAGAITGKISVMTVAGTATSTANFTVTTAPAPTITGFTPATGPRGSSVVLTGTNFTSVTAVKLGTVAVAAGTGYVVNSPTQITLTVPATAVTAKFFVTAAGGMAQSAASYTVILPPTITSFTPASGPVGTLVTINGTNLTAASAVKFGGVSAAGFTVVSAAKITATVPAGALTGAVTVTTVAATATRSTFTVTAPRVGPLAVGAEAVVAEPMRLAVYPNPATAWVDVQTANLPPAGTAGQVVELIDGVGRVVRTVLLTDDGTVPLPLAGVAPGIYIVRVGGTARRLVVE